LSWTTAVNDIRTALSDGPTDKLRYRKKVMNQLDGVNLVFKTFEMRRTSTLVGATGAPAGVFVNNVLATITAEDLTSGEFTMQTAPANGSALEATYYIQWFTDPEIEEFLTSASEWISGQDDWTQLAQGLEPAAKEYSCATAYQKLVSRMSENVAETYQLEDAPDQKRFDPIAAYMKISTTKFKLAFELRDDFYKSRQGRAKAPIFRTMRGRVRDVPPRT
jgi:hypothetical protein